MKTSSKFVDLKVKQQLLYVMIFTFVTVVIWIGGSLLISQKKSGISPDLLELAKALNPNINVRLIEELELRKSYREDELGEFPIYKLIKSKDGQLQRLVPVESELTEIVEEPGATPTPTPQPLPVFRTAEEAAEAASGAAQPAAGNEANPAGETAPAAN